ncbi:acetyl-CoA hydrolase/transferase family protein [Sandaracinus amylolyticus]|uniref:acetyl-CoA hydrolase/transferase family protein n=1 Tax=Sandaracinus amylolyticus TaxID=927083 RepID=UPI001F48AF2E|nr:acetyl-CoA hydrolase/transferase C-terminal domain-containing protein [Sandaracinus amylolyticus]UJR81434.1 4-hydroxybutyrate coenzyme A transferase [Sandaracinus amylolyticus]
MRIVSSPEEAVAPIESGQRVYLHEAAMAPVSLLTAMTERARALRDVEVVHLHTNAPAPYVAPDMAGHVRHNALFVGANVREAVQSGRADFTPVFLSEVPSLFRDGTLPLDVAMVQVSPPNRHGFCRLGVSVACARAAVDHARIVIAEINDRVPRTDGNSAVHVDRIALAVHVDRPLPEHHDEPPGAVERAIGALVSAQIPDGATLQMGIGSIPDAVLDALHSRSDLGIHTEMFSDGVLRLVKSGAVTGACKTRFKNRVVTSFAMGSRELYEHCDHNASIEFHPSDVVNDAVEIASQHAMMAINSAIAIDLTGQVCADSIGDRIWSGIGGQMDFVRGAVQSPGGKAFIALPSTAKNGTLSRIVPRLSPGSGVVTTRGHVQWVVTEHGAVNLRGRSLRERAEMLISIAHPDFRAELRAAAVERKLLV